MQVSCSTRPLSLVYLSVCLCVRYLKKLGTDTDEILWTGSVCDKEDFLDFGEDQNTDPTTRIL